MNRLFVLWMLLASSLLIIQCDDCGNLTCPAIEEGEIIIKLTINDENPEVDLTLYDGPYENGDTLLFETVSQNKVTYIFEAGYEYSVTVQYRDGVKTILAVDGGLLEVTTDDCGCDEETSLGLNVRLKK